MNPKVIDAVVLMHDTAERSRTKGSGTARFGKRCSPFAKSSGGGGRNDETFLDFSWGKRSKQKPCPNPAPGEKCPVGHLRHFN
jgi:hypothetical protein